MSGKKFKTAAGGKGEGTANVCWNCEGIRKATLIAIAGTKHKMGFECGCGLTDKNGVVLRKKSELE